MIIRALKKKYKLSEISSHEYERKGGKSKLPTSQGYNSSYTFSHDTN
jgi:hypothetical protein